MVELKIENVIASFNLQTNLDLQKIANLVDTAEYDPEQFPGLIFKLRSPKTITLIFSRGHCVCSGAKSIPNAKAALTIIYKKLRDLKIMALEKPPKITIQDIITSYNFGKPLILNDISKKLPAANIEYKPNEFPGLVYHDKATDINVLMFSSGTIVGYGNPFLFEIEQVLSKLEEFYK